MRRLQQQVLAQLVKRSEAVADAVLHTLLHLRVRLLEAGRLKNRVPAKLIVAACRDDAPVRAADEEEGLDARSRRIRKDALRVCAFVFEALSRTKERARVNKKQTCARACSQRNEAQCVPSACG